ncbi:MAG: helix-turn-helix domain-containing protein [Candidatus Moduliflexus flocculans]|nr:helix-turn-helix domain-containing protein [Candidatus Moduliflexus flocculans]
MSVDLNKIGSILRANREEAGISLDEVSNVLCLRKSLIQAIESGKWDLLPHEVYVRSYLKEYANFLKIYDEIASELTDKNT